jgi:transglutaminase-like putative cysteine protease
MSMREANWDDIFQRRDHDAPPADVRLNAIFPWEDLLTLLIAAVCFMSVVASIDSSAWVRDMPSLYPIGGAALLLGFGLARVKRSALLLHPIALLLGAGLVYLQLIAIVPGHTPYVRTENIVERMRVWWTAVTHNGISSDSLPFIVLMLLLVWVGTYFSSWAIFRWRNGLLGLIPGGTALMWNIAFIPGQFSYAFVFFLFAAVLLMMRLHLLRRERQWESEGVAYPEFISLTALHATFWVAIVLLWLVWLMPLAERSETANQRWEDFTAPISRHLTPLSRVFVSVSAKKPINVHNLKDALPFQGKIKLNSNEAVKIDVKITPEMAQFLREQSFDEYTSDGWKVNVTGELGLPGGERAGEAPADPASRQDVTINVTVEGGNNDHLFSLGQPVQTDANAAAAVGADQLDVQSLKPLDHLGNGAQYSVTGSANVASLDQLRAAGTDYPAWVRDEYLSLPRTLPRRVRSKARDVTASADTPYDKAAALEQYVRTFPVDYDVPGAPPGQDNVDYFLFDAQRGYFDYHASAMTVMLRSVGIPARIATGYAIDPAARQGTSDTFNLTQRDAFAWPEAYFPGIGWVEFSPTPSEPLIPRTGALGTDAQDALGGDGNSRGDRSAPDLGITSGGPAVVPTPAAVVPGSGSDSRFWWIALIALGAVAAAGTVAAAAARVAWGWGLGGLPLSSQLWEKTLRLAALGKQRVREDETPREFAARLARDVPGAGAVAYVATAYERDRFGHKPLSDDETERLESAWCSLRSALLRRALRLPPRTNSVPIPPQGTT